VLFIWHPPYQRIEILKKGIIFLININSYTELQPSFRIFEIDSETNQIVDFKQYRLNLTKANENTEGPLEWDLAYSFLEVI